MPHSLADQPVLNCPQCGASFTPAVWLIVDTAERPDLLALIRDGSIHRITCPNGHTGQVDAPLLLFRPGEEPPLLLGSAAQTSADQDGAMADYLVDRLAESLGEAWRDDWAADLLPLPRRLLMEALDSPDAAATIDQALADAIPPGISDALGEIMTGLANEGVRLDSAKDLEEALAARPELRQKLEAAVRAAEAPAFHRPAEQSTLPATPPDSLLAALRHFVEAETWLDSYRFVRDHPELLTDAAEATLARYAERAAAVEDESVAGLFAEHLALLRRAREVGVLPAFAEKLGVTGVEFEAALSGK
jgi:hypothetical protein